jgi:hypothetical protein
MTAEFSPNVQDTVMNASKPSLLRWTNRQLESELGLPE